MQGVAVLQHLELPPESGTSSIFRSRFASPRFEELALPLLASIHDSARYLSRSRAEADDLVQETYLKALRGFRTFEAGTNFRAWMFQILRNTFSSSRTSTRHRLRHLHLTMDELTTPVRSGFPDPIEILLCQCRLVATELAVRRLPAYQREVFVLCDLEGASYREAAEALSIPLGTVMSRLARARKAVCRSVQEQFVRRRAKSNQHPEVN